MKSNVRGKAGWFEPQPTSKRMGEETRKGGRKKGFNNDTEQKRCKNKTAGKQSSSHKNKVRGGRKGKKGNEKTDEGMKGVERGPVRGGK